MRLARLCRDASCMPNSRSAQTCSCAEGERVTFPPNNLKSVLVRDFLLQPLICIIPALSNPCQSKDLFLFYFLLTQHWMSPRPSRSQCTLEHHNQVAGALSSLWAVFHWQDFLLVGQILSWRFFFLIRKYYLLYRCAIKYGPRISARWVLHAQ